MHTVPQSTLGDLVEGQGEEDGSAGSSSGTGSAMVAVEPPSETVRSVGSGCRANLERIDDGLLIGWSVAADGERMAVPLTAWIDGRAVAETDEFTYRADLDRAGLAAGHAAFCMDVSSALPASADAVEIALSVLDGEETRFVARRTLPLRRQEPMNPNPSMHVEGHGGIVGWRIERDHRVGLRVDRFPMPPKLHDHASRYTRLSLIDKGVSDEPVRLSCRVETPRASSEDLQLALMLRADRLTSVQCRLRRDDEVVAELALLAETGWRHQKFALQGSAESEIDPDARYTLEIEIPHTGRGHVDIAFCCLAEEPSVRYLNRARRGGETSTAAAVSPSAAARSFVRNGRFGRWSGGIEFDAALPGQELADGWFLECRKNQADRVRITVDSAPRHRDGAAEGGSLNLGLRVRTDTFTGPMRICTVLEPGTLDAPELSLSLSLHALGGAGVARLRRVILLARGVGREVLAHVLGRSQRVRGHALFEYALDEVDMVTIRRACADLGALVLVVEFEERSDVLIDRVELTSGRRRVSEDLPPQETEAVGFEDAAIEAQLHLVHGLESWRGADTPTDASVATAARLARERGAPGGAPACAGSIRAATPYRPSRDYPSVDIVIPIYNALDSVRECIRSVIENTCVPYTIVCVDDGSDEDTKAYLAEVDARFPNVVLLTNEENIGYTRTVNRGLRFSNADHVCVLNSDCIVTPSWLPQLLDCALAGPDVGMVGPLSNAASYQSVPRIRHDDGNWHFNPLPCSLSPADMAAVVRRHSLAAWPSVRVINGFCQLIRREAIDSVGLLDERSFPRGFGEENDFCARVIAAGFRIHVADDTYVFHTKSQSFGHEQRKVLSKEGSAALKSKHPDIDWKAITREIESAPALVELRSRIGADALTTADAVMTADAVTTPAQGSGAR